MFVIYLYFNSSTQFPSFFVGYELSHFLCKKSYLEIQTINIYKAIHVINYFFIQI